MKRLDETTKRLFDDVVESAEFIRKADPNLFGDLANHTPRLSYGEKLVGEELAERFYDLFRRLSNCKKDTLLGLRDKAWEIRKKQRNPDTYNGRETAAYDFIDGVLRFRYL